VSDGKASLDVHPFRLYRVAPLPVEIFQTLQFDFDPAVLSISSIVVVLSAVFIVFVQRVVGLDLILPGARR
jgi:ABC-type spermidine/putrescine transport system permease subunit II